jgi:RNA polymerase sigma-70 factor (ECF subfamily)
MTRTDYTEQDAVTKLLQERDPAVLAHLYEHASAVEYNLSTKFRGIIPSDDLQDIVRDAIVHTFERGSLFDPEVGGIKTWINTYAHFGALSFLRKRMDAQSLDYLAQSIALEAMAVPPDTAYVPSRDIEDVLCFISRRRAAMIRARYYEGLSFEEIACQFKIQEVSVRAEISRGCKDLRKLMKE